MNLQKYLAIQWSSKVFLTTIKKVFWITLGV